MTPIDQPTKNPTRKLTAATLAVAVMEVAKLVTRNTAPEWYDADVWAALTPLVVFAIGYFVRDLPNR